MHSSKNKNVEKPEPFYRPSAPKQKTSAEIINEARNALRTLRTRRPFTPREDQRKLFGSASSRTPENRPPSTFRSGLIFCLFFMQVSMLPVLNQANQDRCLVHVSAHWTM
uniref:Armadillo repeat containing 2 n=1 Tax=Terrapene triunguis TaxID=2587831 RepID=A0A674HXC9_9SAUR